MNGHSSAFANAVMLYGAISHKATNDNHQYIGDHSSGSLDTYDCICSPLHCNITQCCSGFRQEVHT